MNVRLHVDRLVLEGFSLGAGDRARLQRSFEQELTRLLSGGGLNPVLLAGGATPAHHAPAVRLAPGHRPAELGRQIAGAIYRGIGK